MKKTRSITMMTIATVLFCAALYSVAVKEMMTEKQPMKKMELAVERDRETATLTNALMEEVRYKAGVPR